MINSKQRERQNETYKADKSNKIILLWILIGVYFLLALFLIKYQLFWVGPFENVKFV